MGGVSRRWARVTMGVDNVAVHWPRTGRFYEPVAPEEFADFVQFAESAPAEAGPAAALANHIAKTATARASVYTELVDLLLGLEGVLQATDAAAEDEDPVIDPDGCAWIAGGLEKFLAGHERYGQRVTLDTIAAVMRTTLAEAPLAQQQLRWLESRQRGLRSEEHTSELQSLRHLVCRLLLEKKKYRKMSD